MFQLDNTIHRILNFVRCLQIVSEVSIHKVDCRIFILKFLRSVSHAGFTLAPCRCILTFQVNQEKFILPRDLVVKAVMYQYTIGYKIMDSIDG